MSAADLPDREALIGAMRDELDALWYDLHVARRDAMNGQWSINCDGLAERIRIFTGLVGPTPWEQIQLPLLETGVYQRLHAEWGVQADVDMVRVAETRASIEERHRRAMSRDRGGAS